VVRFLAYRKIHDLRMWSLARRRAQLTLNAEMHSGRRSQCHAGLGHRFEARQFVANIAVPTAAYRGGI
jgi:hypothetical protein